jgi:hypothetical protein
VPFPGSVGPVQVHLRRPYQNELGAAVTLVAIRPVVAARYLIGRSYRERPAGRCRFDQLIGGLRVAIGRLELRTALRTATREKGWREC